MRKNATAEVPSVSERDPNEKGTVSVPLDPAADPARQNVPASQSNSDTTPVLAPPSPGKTIIGQETEGLGSKSAKIAASIMKLQATFGKNAAGISGDPISRTGPKGTGTNHKTQVMSNMPANTNSNEVKSATPDEGSPAKDPTAKGNPGKPKVDDKGAQPADATNTDAKMAAFDPQFLTEVGQMMMATEEGRKYAFYVAEKAHGAQIATDTIKAAFHHAQLSQELLAAEDEGEAQATAMWENATPEEREHITKMASVHNLALEALPTELERLAYDAGVKNAAAMADAGMIPPGDPTGGAGADPTGGAGGPPPGADPSAGGADPTGGQEITEDDILQALGQLVQSGEITPEVAEDILKQLSGGGDAGAAPDASGGAGAPPMPPGAADAGSAGVPPPGADAGGPPPEDAPPKSAAELVKQAAVQVLALNL